MVKDLPHSDGAGPSLVVPMAMSKRRVTLMAPHGDGRHVTQDGRSVLRYRRLGKIERLFAWWQNFRRIRG